MQDPVQLTTVSEDAKSTGGLATIQPESIDADASKVVRRLLRHGHEAFLVGGCVRDLLLQRKPKDFDVATSATPPEIKKLFRNSRIIGRRFRLAHIFFGNKIIETSTFRAPPAPPEDPAAGEELIIRRDNVFGTAREDALRRDFTINGLFHDLSKNRVIDHVGGLDDLRARRIRTIGDPRVRIQEDPVRIIRAVKFATRLGFELESATADAIVEFRGLLAKCSVARVLEEIYRLLGSGHAAPAVRLMHELGVLAVLLPEVEAVLPTPADPRVADPVVPIQDRSGLPRAESEGEESERRARDTGPDPGIHRAKDPTPEEAESFRTATSDLVERLLGPDLVEEAGRLTWAHLEGLDRLVAAGTEEAAEAEPPSHSLLLGMSMMGLVWRQLQPEQPLSEAVPALEHVVKTIASRLRVSRRDRERLKQILVAQRRMVHRGKRRRPTALMQRDYFPDAWRLFRLTCEATEGNLDALKRWEQLLGQKSRGGKSRRRRRRRRRPRRRDGQA